MPARQSRLHTFFLKTFLNDLQFLVIRPMTTPSFGVGNGLLAGGVLLLMTANDTKSHITRKDGPRRRRTSECPSGLILPGTAQIAEAQCDGPGWNKYAKTDGRPLQTNGG
jgi:hypothetical protein